VAGRRERRRREGLSLALSAGAHALVLLGLPALLWPRAEPPEELRPPAPEVVQIELVRPAPTARPGPTAAPPPGSAPAQSQARAASRPPPTDQAPAPRLALAVRRAPAPPRPEAPEPLRERTDRERPRRAPEGPAPLDALEPVVECRVRLVSREPELPRLERPAWLQARAPRPVHAPEPAPRAAPGASPESSARTTVARAPREALPFVPHTHGLEGLDPAEAALVEAALGSPPGPPEGDTRPLIDSIQARIDAVTPLVHATAWGCRHHQGRAELRFLIGPRGYPLGHQLLDSSGSYCLDGYISEVLHLAEPYPLVEGWVPVHVDFTRAPQGSVSSSNSSSRPLVPQGTP